MKKTILLAICLILAGCASTQTSINTAVPANGVELLTRMHDVYVANSASDLDSPQFWIEREHLQPVRFLVKFAPAPDAKPDDIRLEKYVPVGGGWLATHVAIMEGGVVRQAEDYSDWRADVAIANDFFVAEKWSDVAHWFSGR